jgi:hypothetical protein
MESPMRQHTMRQFTLACCILGTAIFFGSLAVVGLGLTGTPAATLTLAATSIMILTLVLQLAFIVAQLFASGRAAVPIEYFGADAWPTIIVATGMPGVFWHNLATLAAPPVNLIMPGFVTPLFTVVLLLFARQIQQRNDRHLIGGANPPTAS